ncbi:unnamed protein product [Caenorhabditis bovis]|uniref:Alpha-mannosidase n=1 Tax=Caenorhabditis bovis TaxID=2654633 RepID=A0A8S1EMX4_9PELO|nr:unnamed protein product [Caenorhabditis bovis]
MSVRPMVRLVTFFPILYCILGTSLQDCSWNVCHPIASENDVITVHLIAHTHDDLGWIKTVDQYYYGARPDLVPVGVQYIYNTVIEELLKNPDRRFSFAETGFLWRWYTSNGHSEKHQLQKLVKNGQIELIGGGWVQNDEATSHYVDIIDQMTLGLQRLYQLFGECGKPKVGWQIDPFGHSREMANIYSQMGYDAIYFARMHYLEKKLRLKNRTLEFIWDSSNYQNSKIFTGAFFQDNYGPPDGFCWDTLCGDDPIMDIPNLEEYNVDEKVDAFVEHVRKQAAVQETNQIMLLMGSDFQYTNANTWYINLDKLIKHVNARTAKKVKVIYSTPSCYTQAVLSQKPHLSIKRDDLYPYASGNHSYWTGFFTSRPTFKGMIREASALLQLGKQMDMIANLGPEDDSDIDVLREASALTQHHDAVTGTAKENVTRDYEKQLAEGMHQIQVVMNEYLKKLSPGALDANVVLCPLINETICNEMKNVKNAVIVLFNSNTRTYKGVVRIPYYENSVVVTNVNGSKIDHELVPTFKTGQLKNPNRAPYEIHVFVNVPPVGYTTIFARSDIPSSRQIVAAETTFGFDKPFSIENEFIRLSFDADGFLNRYTDKSTLQSNAFRQAFFYYEGTDSNDTQPSGAYIFRPKSQKPKMFDSLDSVQIIETSLVSEVRQIFSAYISQTIRLSRNADYVEFEWIVGPIPKEEKNFVSKEVVTRYITELKTDDYFYTDSNGRQAMKRRFRSASSFEYEDTEPVAGNYYPITSFAYMKWEKVQFSLVTDRSQGCTSNNGEMEIMLHRRCFYDDHFGVEEALDEPGIDGKGLVAMGKHRVFFSDVKNGPSRTRVIAADTFHKPVLAFATSRNPTKFKYARNLEYSGIVSEFPPSIHLLTLEKWAKNNNGLIRFENLLYDDDEVMLDFERDVKELFKSFKIVDYHELLLGANRNASTNETHRNGAMRPGEIRTFAITIERY